MAPFLGLALKFLPSLGSLFFSEGSTGEKVTGMVGEAVQSIFGTDDVGSIEAAIAKDPSLALQLKSKLLDIQAEGQRMVHEETMERMHTEHERRTKEIEDTAHARSTWSANKGVLILGFTIITMVSLMNAMAVYFAFDMLWTDSDLLKGKDVGLIAAVFTFVGNVMGGMQAMAIQVVAFFFGSSKGQEDNSKAITQAFTKLGSKP